MSILVATLLFSGQAGLNSYSNPKLIDLSDTIPTLLTKLKLKVKGTLPPLYPIEAAVFGSLSDEELLQSAFQAYGYSAAIPPPGAPFGDPSTLTVEDHNTRIAGNHVPPNRAIRSAMNAVRAQGKTLPLARVLGLDYIFGKGIRSDGSKMPRLKLSKFETGLTKERWEKLIGPNQPIYGYLSGWISETEDGYRVNGTWLNRVDPPKENVWFECPFAEAQKKTLKPKVASFDLSLTPIDSASWKVWQAWTTSQHRTGWFDPEKAILRKGLDPKMVAEERARSPWETVCRRLQLKSQQPALLVLDDAWLTEMVNLTERESAWPLNPSCGLENNEIVTSHTKELKRVSVLGSNLEGWQSIEDSQLNIPPRQSLYLALKKHKGSIAQGCPSFGFAGLYADYSRIEAGIIARAKNEAVGWSVREWPAVKALSTRPVPWLQQGELSEESDYLARYAIDRTYFFSREVMTETQGGPGGIRRIFTIPESTTVNEARRIKYFPTQREVLFAQVGSSAPSPLGARVPSTLDDYADRVASVIAEQTSLTLDQLLADLKFAFITEPVIRLQVDRTPFFTDVPTTAIVPPTDGYTPFDKLPDPKRMALKLACEAALRRMGRMGAKVVDP